MRAVIILTILTLAFTSSVINELSLLEHESESKLKDTQGCWLNASGRGAGKPIHTCRDDQDKVGLLCYPKCNEGYYGLGPVCWQECPNGFRNDGAFCYKPTSYGRGAGYALWNEGKCNRENSQGCEKYGLMYYPRCNAGFRNIGCCVCSPICPSGMTDIGISCAKSSYGRTAGYPLECSSTEDEDTGLCYPQCANGMHGLGPVCWGECPAGFERCGALCLKGEECADRLKTYMTDVVAIINDFAKAAYTRGVIDVAKFAIDLTFPTCQ